jgi:hypothetical protein
VWPTDYLEGEEGAFVSERLIYLEQETSPSRLTKVWKLISVVGEVELGVISWYSQWRRFVFRPAIATMFDAECLGEIARFCATQTEVRKLEREQAGKKVRE